MKVVVPKVVPFAAFTMYEPDENAETSIDTPFTCLTNNVTHVA